MADQTIDIETLIRQHGGSLSDGPPPQKEPDFGALIKQYGGSLSNGKQGAKEPDYQALIEQHGGTLSDAPVERTPGAIPPDTTIPGMRGLPLPGPPKPPLVQLAEQPHPRMTPEGAAAQDIRSAELERLPGGEAGALQRIEQAQQKFGSGREGSPGAPTLPEIGWAVIPGAAEGVAAAAGLAESAATRQSAKALSLALRGYFTYQAGKGVLGEAREATKARQEGDYLGWVRHMSTAGLMQAMGYMNGRAAVEDYQGIANIAKAKNVLQEELNARTARDMAAEKMAKTGPARIAAPAEPSATPPAEPAPPPPRDHLSVLEHDPVEERLNAVIDAEQKAELARRGIVPKAPAESPAVAPAAPPQAPSLQVEKQEVAQQAAPQPVNPLKAAVEKQKAIVEASKAKLQPAQPQQERETESLPAPPLPGPPVRPGGIAAPAAAAESQPAQHPAVTPAEERGPGWVGNIPRSEIRVDAPRFQFKQNVGQGGAGDEFKDVTKWDPESAGILAVWKDPANGQTYVVNGHHRMDMAARAENPPDTMTVRYLDAKNAQEARTKGALINIREGRGESTDAAKVFRDMQLTPEKQAAFSKELGKGKVATEGLALANLAQPIYDDVMSGELSPARGAVLGAGIASHADQRAVYDLMKQQEKGGRRLTNDQVGELIQLNNSAPTKTESTADEAQGGLFGVEEMTRSLLPEKAIVSDYVRSQLGSEKKLFGVVGTQAAAEKLGAAGNVIKAGENAAQAQSANQGLALYDKLKTKTGPIGQLLDRAAQSIADGESANDVKQRAYREIRGALRTQLDNLSGVPRVSTGGAEGLGSEGPRPVAAGGTPAAAEPEVKPPQRPGLTSQQAYRPETGSPSAFFGKVLNQPRYPHVRDYPNPADLVTDAHAVYRKPPAAESGTLWLNRPAGEIIRQMLPDQAGPFAGTVFGGEEARYLADQMRAVARIPLHAPTAEARNALHGLADQLEQGAADGTFRAVVAMEGTGGRRLDNTISTARHEGMHQAQVKMGGPQGEAGAIDWEQFHDDPLVARGAEAVAAIRSESEGQPVSPASVIHEVPAYIHAGQWDQLGYSLEEAATVYDRYLSQVADLHGPGTLDGVLIKAHAEIRRAIRDYRRSQGEERPSVVPRRPAEDVGGREQGGGAVPPLPAGSSGDRAAKGRDIPGSERTKRSLEPAGRRDVSQFNLFGTGEPRGQSAAESESFQRQEPAKPTPPGKSLEERRQAGVARGTGGDVPGESGLFDTDAERQSQVDTQRGADKLLGDQLTAQIKSGLAAKPSKLKPAENRSLFEEPRAEQGGLFGSERGSFSRRPKPPFLEGLTSPWEKGSNARKPGSPAFTKSLAEQDKDYGLNVRRWFTARRDVWDARNKQILESLRKVLPDPIDQEALAIYRDFKNRPGELKQWLAGTHPAYGEVRDLGHARENIEKLRKPIERAMNPTDAMKQADQTLTAIAASSLAEGKRLGFIDKHVKPEEYVTHLLTPETEEEPGRFEEAGKALGNKIGLNFPYKLQRNFPTLLDAAANNWKPRTLNAFTAFQTYGDKFATARATHLLIEQLRASNVGVWGTKSSKDIPKGWKEIAPHAHPFRNLVGYTDEAGQPQGAYQTLFVPPVIEEALRPITDPDYTSKIAGFRRLRVFQSYAKAAQLGLSFFHAVSMNYGALANMGPAGYMKAVQAARKGSLAPGFHDMERDLIAHGGTSSIQGKVYEAYGSTESTSLPTAAEAFRQLPGVKQLDKAAKAITDLTFNKIQRPFKVADYAMHKAAWLAKNPDATPAEQTAAMRSIAKELNGVYGGIHWENIGVNKSTLEMARAIVLAPDWTYSNYATGSHAFEKGTPAGSMARKYWLRSMMFGLAATQAASLMLSRKPSKRPTQVYLGQDKEGKDIYQNMFFKGAAGDASNLAYNIKDYGLPVGFFRVLANKEAPVLRTVGELGQNKTFLGQPIVQKGLNPLVGTARSMFYTAKGMSPIPWSAGNIAEMMLNRDKYNLPLEALTTMFAGTPPSHVKEKPEKETQPLWQQLLTGKPYAPAPKRGSDEERLHREQKRILR